MARLLVDGNNTTIDTGTIGQVQVDAAATAIWLPGSSGNYVSCPDAAGLDVAGDLTLVAHVALDDWTPAAKTSIVGKFTTTGNQRSYRMYITTGGLLGITWSTIGSDAIAVDSTSATGLADGTAKWLAVTLDVNNGASGNDTRHWTSDDGVTWTQLGATVTTATATSIFASTAVLEVGAVVIGTVELLAGRVYSVSVRSGIGDGGEVGGTVVAEWDADRCRGSRYRDALGNVWTVNGSAWAVQAA